ncbi:hypothetical protein AJ79_01548 [Helicocarpus griseus UAMH5409]|uniref:Uncharacterized protein n=1 Tax=Helicocarpus griseus UAMH5409 TaxID=1447875 RepID=A0A2B7Y5C5_9EURO|nr:hypothetical protein AJ79_01548 [Helicocarpus griseus UAMH5409]
MQPKILLPLLFPSLSAAMTSFSWSFSDAPKDGSRNVTFPITVLSAAHNKQWYFAQQYGFVNGGMGYCGVQPQEDKNGRSQMRGVFSSFTEGTTTDDENCSDGADGGPGVSCGFVFDHDYSHTLDIVVSSEGNDKWVGTAVNTKTGKHVHIGSWTMPSGSGNIDLGGQAGFVERYLYNDEDKCDEIPRIEVHFHLPQAGNAKNSSISSMKEYDFCKGKKNWDATEDANGDGWTISMGF